MTLADLGGKLIVIHLRFTVAIRASAHKEQFEMLVSRGGKPD